MNFLFPHLDDRSCREIVDSWGGNLPAFAFRHQQQTYAPLGGHRATEDSLQRLRSAVLELTLQNARAQNDRAASDALVALTLRREMPITCHEASQPGLWQFISCVLLPDVLLWRFGKNGEIVEERWRGIGKRNTFGRLWWRAEILETSTRSPEVLHRLREDEIVQIMERPSIAGNKNLARLMAVNFIQAVREPDDLTKAALAGINGRQRIMRELAKRLLRLGCVRAFDAMAEGALEDLVRQQLRHTCRILAANTA